MEQSTFPSSLKYSLDPTSPEEDNVTIRILRNFRVIFGLLQNQFRELEITVGITAPQLWILKEVSKQPGIGVLRLAEKLSIHRSTCSLQVDSLVSKDLLTKRKSNKDRRRVGISVSPAGETIIRKLGTASENMLSRTLDGMPIAEIIALEKSVAALIERYQQLHTQT